MLPPRPDARIHGEGPRVDLPPAEARNNGASMETSRATHRRTSNAPSSKRSRIGLAAITGTHMHLRHINSSSLGTVVEIRAMSKEMPPSMVTQDDRHVEAGSIRGIDDERIERVRFLRG
jgi:hypothetical protein